MTKSDVYNQICSTSRDGLEIKMKIVKKKRPENCTFTNIVKKSSGTYGKIYSATHSFSMQQVALKCQDLFNEEDGLSGTALREIDILKRLKHPYILPLDRVFLKKNKVWTCMRLCKKSLWSWIIDRTNV
jgi:serine/threonine protein kinase